MTVDGALIAAWLAARSVTRELPAPVPDLGGWRVDSGLPDERCRYVFAAPCDGLRMLGEAIDEPWIALKLSGPQAELFDLLPDRWRLTKDTDSKVMVRDAAVSGRVALPAGYRLDVAHRDDVSHVRILAGERLAASGYAAECGGVFVYDRIVTDPDHRRRGLATAVMTALGQTRRAASSREILTATPAGRALYLRLGWRVYSDWTTAMIPPPVNCRGKAPQTSKSS